MIYFIDVNGVLQNIDDQGVSSIPYKCLVKDDKIIVINSDGFVIEEYQKWNSLEEILSTDKALKELLIMTYHKMVVDSKPLPDDFAKLISDNILDLF